MRGRQKTLGIPRMGTKISGAGCPITARMDRGSDQGMTWTAMVDVLAMWAPPPTGLFVKFQNDKQKKIFKKMMIRGNCRLLLSWMEFFFFRDMNKTLVYKIMQRPE